MRFVVQRYREAMQILEFGTLGDCSGKADQNDDTAGHDH
jgi:hypothetical protein